MKRTFFSLALLLSFAVAFANQSVDRSVVPYEVAFSTNVNSFCKLIQLGDYEAVKALVQQGEDVNQKSTGLTPLMFAARHNRADIAQLLIDNGAKLNARSEKGNLTALEMAERYKATETFEVIEEATEAKKKKKKK